MSKGDLWPFELWMITLLLSYCLCSCCLVSSHMPISELLELATRHGATFDLSHDTTNVLVTAFEQRLLEPVSPLASCTDLRELLLSNEEEEEGEEELPSNPVALAFRARCYSALLVCKHPFIIR